MRVFAIVPNWNGGEELSLCLASLAMLDPPPAGIVLVDNGSTDGSAEAALEEHPSLAVLRNGANLGYGEASNQGVRHALEHGADACLLVNNDAVLMRDTLDLLVRAMAADPWLGVAGPRILLKGFQPVERLWSAGGMLTWRENVTTLVGHLEPDDARWRCTMPVDYITGCVMLVRRAVFETVGFIDPVYFAYMEDVDFCLRAAQAGFRCACVGGAVAYHRGSASTGVGYTMRRKYMMGVNSVWFLRRFGRPRHWARFFVYDVLSLPFAWAQGLALGRAGAVLAKGKGILDGLSGRRVEAHLVEDGRALWFPRRGERKRPAA